MEGKENPHSKIMFLFFHNSDKVNLSQQKTAANMHFYLLMKDNFAVCWTKMSFALEANASILSKPVWDLRQNKTRYLGNSHIGSISYSILQRNSHVNDFVY